MLTFFFLVVLLFHGGTSSSPLSRATIGSPKSSSVDYLLPTDIQPEHYTIELEPDFENESFNGSVSIEFTVLNATRDFYFHREDLEIDGTSFVLESQDGLPTTTVSGYSCVEDDRQYCVIQFADELVAENKYTLTIGSFSGMLHIDNSGFYLAKYVDEQGNEVKFGTTQFQATSARRAFPCLDEPALKASFTLSIIRPQNYNSISNTKRRTEGEVVTAGRYRDTFETTVKMSTYLLAFIVSQLDHTETLERHTVYARPAEIKQGNGEYALEIGDKILKGIEDFLSVNYSLAKMDQAAIPNDYYSSGAMENWGLVTYREGYLLYSENTSLRSQKQTITTIIAHEFGHQWFGNLVSPEWWSYIWLNEGFATYFEFYGASLAEPTWNLMDQFVVRNLQYAFGPDSLESTRAMNADAGSPSDISALFDRVAYEKSGSVIRMFETFLTTDVFKNGLNKYLNEREFKAANPGHLYSALQEAVDDSNLEDLLPEGKGVSDVLSTWDSNPGYPVVKVERNYSSGKVTFSQSRFLLQSSVKDSSQVWYIPINYAVEGDSDFDNLSTDLWLTSGDATISVDGLGSSEWLIVNKQERGYYRVNYDENNWMLIIDYLNSNNYNKVHKTNRAQLLDDAINLARSGRLDYKYFFELTRYLSRETDYIPLYSFFQALTFIDTKFAASEEYTTLKDFVVDLLGAAYEKLGTAESNSDSHLDILNRVNVLNWLCSYGHSGCRQAAHEQLHLWKSGEIETITPNLQSVYFCGASYEADFEHWDFLYQQLEKHESLRTRIISGLGCSQDEAILKEYLDRAINSSNSVFSLNEQVAIFISVLNSGNVGVKFLTNYLKENYDNVNEVVSSSLVVAIVAAKITTEEQLNELETIVLENGLCEILLSAGKENVAWCKQYLSSLESWFVALRGASSSVSAGISLIVAAVVARLML